MAVTLKFLLRDLGDGSGRRSTAPPAGVHRHRQLHKETQRLRENAISASPVYRLSTRFGNEAPPGMLTLVVFRKTVATHGNRR